MLLRGHCSHAGIAASITSLVAHAVQSLSSGWAIASHPGHHWQEMHEAVVIQWIMCSLQLRSGSALCCLSWSRRKRACQPGPSSCPIAWFLPSRVATASLSMTPRYVPPKATMRVSLPQIAASSAHSLVLHAKLRSTEAGLPCQPPPVFPALADCTW